MRLASWWFCGISLAASAAEKPAIFPTPQKMALQTAAFRVDGSVPVLLPANAAPAEMAVARQLAAELSDGFGIAVRLTRASALPPGRFILMGSQSNPLVKQYCARAG